MRRTLCVLACLAALPCGCMTLVNHSPFFCPDEEKRDRPFGGVRGDAEMIADGALTAARGEVKDPRELAGLTFGTTLCIIDLPLSLIADTVWLAHDVRATREKRVRPPADPPREAGEGDD